MKNIIDFTSCYDDNYNSLNTIIILIYILLNNTYILSIYLTYQAMEIVRRKLTFFT